MAAVVWWSRLKEMFPSHECSFSSFPWNYNESLGRGRMVALWASTKHFCVGLGSHIFLECSLKCHSLWSVNVELNPTPVLKCNNQVPEKLKWTIGVFFNVRMSSSDSQAVAPSSAFHEHSRRPWGEAFAPIRNFSIILREKYVGYTEAFCGPTWTMLVTHERACALLDLPSALSPASLYRCLHVSKSFLSFFVFKFSFKGN